jgi:hypothetical protein
MKRVVLNILFCVISITLSFAQGGPGGGGPPGGGGGGPTGTNTIADGIWSDASIWDNGVPTNTKSATINHNVTITSNSITKNLTITDTLTNNGFLLEVIQFTNNGHYEDVSGTVEIRQNGSISGNDTYLYNLSVKGGSVSNTTYIRNLLTVPSGVFNVSGGNLILVNDGTYDGRVGNCTGGISGNFTWNKYISKSCTGWSMYGFPTTATLADIDLYYTFGWWNNTYWFDETVLGGLNDGWVPYTSSAGSVQQGLGIIHYNNPFTKTISLNVGLSNTVNFPITYSTTGVPANDGFNMVGNPFPGTIDWDNANWVKTNVAGTIYTWSNCNGSYGSYNGGLGTGGMDGEIASGEGFWIQTTAAAPALSAPKSVMLDGSEPLYKMNNSPINYVRFEFNGDDIIVRLENGSKKFDFDTDAIMFGQRSLYTSDEDDVKYSIDTRSSTPKVVIPLWTKGSDDLYITENTLNGYRIYLYEKISDTYYELSNSFYMNGFNEYSNDYDLVFSRKPIFNKPNKKDIMLGRVADRGVYFINFNGKTIDNPQKNQIYIQVNKSTQERKLIMFYE